MRTSAWWVGLWCVVLVACEPMGGADAGDDAGAVVVDAGRSNDAGAEDAGVVDAGVDAGTSDAGTPDAGGFDAGPQDSVTLSASTTFDDRVQLTWDAGDVFALGWVIERDGQMVAQVGGGLRRYDDFNAPAGRFEAFDASASQTFGHAIELEWSAPDASAGPMTRYRVRMSQPPYLASPNAMGQRAPPVLSGWRVTRADGGWLLSPSESSLEDTAAPGATLSVQSLSATARPEDWVSAVMLNVDASVTTAPNPVDYVVTAWSDAGVERALAVTGHRRLSGAVYQWQRSDADSPDASWSDLPRVHGMKWFDAEAPFNEGRYYRVALRHDGVEHVSNEVRALLWRPRFVSGYLGRYCLLRDDGLVRCTSNDLGVLNDVVDFATTPSGACGVHVDGGLSCWHDGTLIHPSLEPVQRVVSGDRTCGWADAGVFCLDGTRAPELRALSSSPTSSTLCGWPHDGGDITCNGVPQPGATAVAGPNCVLRDAGHLDCPALGVNVLLPTTAGAWVDAQQLGQTVCMRTNQGFVSCLGGTWQSATPVWSATQFQKWHIGNDRSCGLSLGGRVKCHGIGSEIPTLPPSTPVTQVATRFQNSAVFLHASGMLELYRNFNVYHPGDQLAEAPGPSDIVTSISVYDAVDACGVLTDGSVKCLGMRRPPLTASPFVSLGATGGKTCGLKQSGAITCWQSTAQSFDWTGGPWRWLGGTNDERVCAVDDVGAARCEPSHVVPLPVGPLREVGTMADSTCGLTTNDSIVCNPTTPAGLNTHRYRQLATEADYGCGLTHEGIINCWDWNGTVFQPSPWNDYVSISVGQSGVCGVRVDQTAACVTWTGESFAHSLP